MSVNYHIDALHTVIRNALWGITYPDIITIAKALHEAGWAPRTKPTISDVDTLDALPVGAVVLATDQTALYRRRTASSFCWQVGVERVTSERIMELHGDVYLLFVE